MRTFRQQGVYVPRKHKELSAYGSPLVNGPFYRPVEGDGKKEVEEKESSSKKGSKKGGKRRKSKREYLQQLSSQQQPQQQQQANSSLTFPSSSSSSYSQENIDHPTYLLPEPLMGKCDIFFPLNFPLVSFILNSTMMKNQEVENNNDDDGLYRPSLKASKSYLFLREHVDKEGLRKVTLKDGYNPLVQDFVNTAILRSDETA